MKGSYGLGGLFGGTKPTRKRVRRGKFEKVRAQSAKRIERIAKAVEKSYKGSYGLGNLIGGDEEVVPKIKRVSRGKFEKARGQSAKRVARRAKNTRKCQMRI